MAEARGLTQVTGASSGIGLELAKLFADDGYDLIVAGDDDGIHASADQFAGSGVDVRPLQVDLRKPDDVERLYRSAIEDGRRLRRGGAQRRRRTVGAVRRRDLDHDLDIVDLNVRSTVHLAKLLLRDMAARGAGKVLFASSRRARRVDVEPSRCAVIQRALGRPIPA